jgi:hypothetical protein
MVKVQLLVDEWHVESLPRLCVLAGPTFRDLLGALQALPSRAYAAPDFWVVDTDGIVRLREAGLHVEDGALDPVLVELAHRATLGIARDWLPPWRPSAGDRRQ